MNKMAKNAAAQMKDLTFSGKCQVSIIAFLQDNRTACDACNMQEGPAMWLFNPYLAGPIESVVKG